MGIIKMARGVLRVIPFEDVSNVRWSEARFDVHAHYLVPSLLKDLSYRSSSLEDFEHTHLT